MTQEALKLLQEALAGLKDVEKRVRELVAENKALKEALAQPERKPLTDEHIGVIAIKSQDGISPHDDTLRFARAIEAAHGIKE